MYTYFNTCAYTLVYTIRAQAYLIAVSAHLYSIIATFLFID